MRHFSSLLLAFVVSVAGCGWVLADAPAATPAPAAPVVQPAPPVTPAAPQLVVLTGKLTQITAPKKATGSLTATLTTDTVTVAVELAPQSYLDKITLSLKEADAVTITGMERTNKKTLALTVSVQTLKLGEQTYTLRDEKGKPMWEASWKRVKLNGTVKVVKTPEATAAGEAALVSFTLETNTTSQTVLLAPADYLTRIGLALKAGDVVQVNGEYDAHATQPSAVTATTVKTLGVVYTLRDKKGHGLWETAPPVQPAPATTTPAPGAAPK